MIAAWWTTATWWLRLGDYDHGNGYDDACCGSTTTAITTLAMVTIAAAMATIAEPMSVLDRPPPPTANFINGGVLLPMLAVNRRRRVRHKPAERRVILQNHSAQPLFC